MKIALDVMGGDYAPFEQVKGAVYALNEVSTLKIVLVGKKDLIDIELKKYNNVDMNRIEIIHTDEYIAMDEKDSPVMAVRKKKAASMNIALEMAKNKEVDGTLSAGNTGALMSASLFKLKRIEGILRPALTIPFPSHTGNFAFLDAGANKDCKPESFEQFAIMGTIYAEVLLGRKSPKVALLNIGEEDGKGNELANSAYELLSKSNKINFVGNIEARDMIEGKVDVVVTDGFTGNMVLKTAEGTASFISAILKEEIMKNISRKIGGMLVKPAFEELKRKMDYSETGGAIFLGLDGISIKAHGSSNYIAIKNGLKVANFFAEKDFIQEIKNRI